MTLRKWLLAMLVSMSPTGTAFANADDNLKTCRTYLKTSISLVENLQKTIPPVPEESNKKLTEKYKSMGMPKFNTMRNEPNFYLWLLHHDAKKAHSELTSQAVNDSTINALNALAYSGFISLFISNVRNSWTEYAAYSGDKSISEKVKNEISDDMMNASVLFNFYLTCLVQNLDQ